MRIGIDFDNTIADYDAVFVEAARERGWVGADFEGPKKLLRDTVRKLEDGELKWQVLQGDVYGPRMQGAAPFAGVMAFLEAVRRRGCDVVVVSHKTRFANHAEVRVDLREAALAWMEARGFLDPKRTGLSRERVHFADTRAEKIERIGQLGCAIFIDDLEEVFADPSFPGHIDKILFTAMDDPAAGRDIVVKASWTDISHHVLNGPRLLAAEVWRVATDLAGARIRSIDPVRAGANNRLLRVTTDDGTQFALKQYPQQPSDPRDRLKTEFCALQLMHQSGLTQVPEPRACDPASGFALYQWIDGRPPAASESAIDQAIALVVALKQLSGAASASTLPLASEACFSPGDIVAQVERRFAALKSVAADHSELQAFLSADVAETLSRAIARAREHCRRMQVDFDASIDPSARCLSPSDFGFHNAIQTLRGQIVFLDFEYFGWDDPVKLTCDFMLHPGMNLPDHLAQQFRLAMVRLFVAQADFEARLHVSLPLYALRWTMILLNEFLPERWARRLAAGVESEHREALAQQLGKARAMLLKAERAIG